MEEQLLEQLKALEGKIGSPGGVVKGNGGNSSGFVDDMTIDLLRGEVAKKELEILKLNKTILDLQEQLKSGAPAATPAATPVPDKGESKNAKLEEELAVSKTRLAELTNQNNEMQTAIGAAERLLAVTEKKLQMAEDRSKELSEQVSAWVTRLTVAAARCSLRYSELTTLIFIANTCFRLQVEREKKSKEQAMALLEEGSGADSGGISPEIAAMVEEEKKKAVARVLTLEEQLKTASEKAGQDLLSLSKRMETKEKSLLEAQQKINSMRDDAIKSMGVFDEQLEDEKKEHIAELDKIKKELHQEQLSRLSQITDLELAKAGESRALAQKQEMVAQLGKNQEKIKEAQGLFENNERLHKALAIETERRKALHNKIEDMKGRIRVYVRIRPMSNSEMSKGCSDVCKNEGKKTCVILPDVENEKDAKSWDFDSVFAGTPEAGNTQENVFKDTQQLIQSTIDGFNVCVFAYGQTGSGKTFTMFGAGGVGGGIDSDGKVDPLTGLAPRSAAELFRVLKEKQASR